MQCFDEVCNDLLSEYLQIDEMALKKAKKFEDYKADPYHGQYSILDATAGDKDKVKQVVTTAVKKILDDLDQYPDQTYPGKRTDYQDKIATFIRQAINEVI